MVFLCVSKVKNHVLGIIKILLKLTARELRMFLKMASIFRTWLVVAT